MATATKERKKTHKALAKLPVEFKNLSVGDTITTLGFTIARERCTLDFAEEAFCGKRVVVRILLGSNADPDQGVMWDDVSFDVEGTVDIKKFSVTPKKIGAGLSFLIESIEIRDLVKFAKKSGVLLIIKVLGDVKDHEESDEDQEEDEDEGKEGQEDEE